MGSKRRGVRAAIGNPKQIRNSKKCRTGETKLNAFHIQEAEGFFYFSSLEDSCLLRISTFGFPIWEEGQPHGTCS